MSEMYKNWETWGESGIAGALIALRAVKAVRLRNGEAAMDVLTRLCQPYAGRSVYWYAFDVYAPWRSPSGYDDFTLPHPNAALGMLILEAFGKNGLASHDRYLPIFGDILSKESDAAVEAAVDELVRPFERKFDLWNIGPGLERPAKLVVSENGCAGSPATLG